MTKGLVSLFLICVAAVLGRFDQVKGSVPVWSVGTTILVAWVIAASLYLFLSKITRSPNKSFLVILLAGLFFFLFHEIQTFADSYLSNYVRRRWIAVILLGGVGFAGIFILWTKKELQKAGDFFHVITRVVGVTSMVFLVVSWNSGPSLIPRKGDVLVRDSLTTTNKPDVYFFLFDAYTSIGSLARYWNDHDTNFLTFLTSRGFQVLTNGEANYISTPFCLSSVLNMDYTNVDHRKNTHPSIVNFLWKDIKASEVPRAFTHLGYGINNLSFFELLDKQPAYNCPEVKYLGMRGIIIGKSPIGYYLEGKERWTLGEINLDLVRRVKQIAKSEGKPKFVYAHFMMPHQPFIFARDGTKLPLGIEQGTRKKEFYLEQSRFVNQKIEEMVTEILNNSKVPPIIILQGDHGYRFLDIEDQEKEAKSTFQAYYLPGKTSVLPDSFTPVNTFRFLFNEYFGAKIELLPNQQFLSPLGFE